MNNVGLHEGEHRILRPLRRFLPWGSPTDEIRLFAGPLSFRTAGGSLLPPAPGHIDLLLRSGSHLNWSVDLDRLHGPDRGGWERAASTEGKLQFDFLGTPTEIIACALGAGYGFIPGAHHATQGASIDQVVTHWVNLLDDVGWPRDVLREDKDDGTWCEWPGRRVIAVPPWRLTLDSRSDHAGVYSDAKRSYRSALTHTMKIERQDSQPFSADEAEQVVGDLHMSFSFSLGRWAAPVLPVGLDFAGVAVFTTWAPWLCDTPGHDADRWWPQHRQGFLDAYLQAIVTAFTKPGERDHLAFLITSAIATGQGAFLEQRLATAIAAIEYLSWVEEVLSRTKTEEEWRRTRGGAKTRIRRLLARAHIPLTIDPHRSPALAAFAKSQNLPDAPATLIRVRDHVTHPKERQNIYGAGSPLADATRLASRYLDLLILHRIDYNGFTRDRTITTGWEGASELVPWARAHRAGRTAESAAR